MRFDVRMVNVKKKNGGKVLQRNAEMCIAKMGDDVIPPPQMKQNGGHRKSG